MNQIRPNSQLAIASLVSGILGWTLVPFIGTLVAIITGHMARSEIRRSNGQLGGDGMAIAGMSGAKTVTPKEWTPPADKAAQPTPNAAPAAGSQAASDAKNASAVQNASAAKPAVAQKASAAQAASGEKK